MATIYLQPSDLSPEVTDDDFRKVVEYLQGKGWEITRGVGRDSFDSEEEKARFIEDMDWLWNNPEAVLGMGADPA